MMNSHEVVIGHNFNKLTQPMLNGTSQQQALMAAQHQGQGLQPMNPGQRMAAPGVPQGQSQGVTPDAAWEHLRNVYMQNPTQGFLALSQLESQYGPGILAKPLVHV
jgi:hypothetical protein